jgi:hypothetical protein
MRMVETRDATKGRRVGDALMASVAGLVSAVADDKRTERSRMSAAVDRGRIWEQAVIFAMGVLRTASDWQEAQDALANDPRFDALWPKGAELEEAQAIIREAENRLETEAA